WQRDLLFLGKFSRELLERRLIPNLSLVLQDITPELVPKFLRLSIKKARIHSSLERPGVAWQGKIVNHERNIMCLRCFFQNRVCCRTVRPLKVLKNHKGHLCARRRRN